MNRSGNGGHALGGATPKFFGGPNVRPTQSITSFSTESNK